MPCPQTESHRGEIKTSIYPYKGCRTPYLVQLVVDMSARAHVPTSVQVAAVPQGGVSPVERQLLQMEMDARDRNSWESEASAESGNTMGNRDRGMQGPAKRGDLRNPPQTASKHQPTWKCNLWQAVRDPLALRQSSLVRC